MDYLLDTVAIIRHFLERRTIGASASQILQNQENTFYISIMSLIEILYLSEKKRIEITLDETLEQIHSRENYKIIEFDDKILKAAQTVQFPELHDRLILATAKWLDAPILSSDKAFKSVGGITIIWK